MAKTVAEVKGQTLFEKLRNIKAETLVEMLHDKLAKDEGRTIVHTQDKEETKALLQSLLYILA